MSILFVRLVGIAVLLASVTVQSFMLARGKARRALLRSSSSEIRVGPFGGDEKEKEDMIARYMEEKGMSKEGAEKEYKDFKSNPYYSLEKVRRRHRRCGLDG